MPPDFTAHNIRLDDGSLTLPSRGWEMSEHPAFLATKSMLELLYPLGFAGRSLIDLGCLEGGFTVEFARLGLRATGIEIRQSNLENCRYVKDKVALPNLSFVHDDVWNLAHHGVSDIVFCRGLLYHLDRPRRCLELIAGACRRLLMLETYYAAEDTPHHALSDLTEHDGMRGRWSDEYREGDATRQETAKWASWENRRSFWPARLELVKALHTLGFSPVFESLDVGAWFGAKERIMIIAVKVDR